MSTKLLYEEEILKEWCKNSYSYNEVLRKAEKSTCTSTRETLKKYIKIYNIDISHFTHSRSTISTKSVDSNGLRICGQCNILKNHKEDYYWSKGKTRNICKECVKINEREKYAEKTDKLNNYKKKLSCKKCGENRYYLLDFHHRDPNEKEFAISKNPRISFEKTLKEIEKCDVLCSNCHREWHFLEKEGIQENYISWLNK